MCTINKSGFPSGDDTYVIITLFVSLKHKVKNVVSSSLVKATGALGLFPFPCFFICFWTKEPRRFSQTPGRLLCLRNSPFSSVVVPS